MIEYEIHIFLGSVCVTQNATTPYPIGERHAFLLYLKENRDTGYDSAEAEEILLEHGFDQIEFSKAGKVNPEKISNKNREYHKDAVTLGSSLIIYSDPIE